MREFPERRGNRGINLVELLIGLAIFATAVLLIVGLFPTAARSVRQAQQITVATDLACSRFDELNAQAFENIAAGLSTVTMASQSAGSAVTTDYTIQTLVEQPSPDLKHIEVMVSWTTDQSRLVRMETYRARYR